MTGIAAEPAVGTDQAGAHDEAEPFDAEERRVGAAHVGSLKAKAAAGGLRFEIFLPPGLAVWLLDLVEKGLFKDPAEAAFVMLGE
jgi:hypothetical protein